MTELALSTIEQQARQAVSELLDAAKLQPGDIFVVGCSSSEILGGKLDTLPAWKPLRLPLRGFIPCCRSGASSLPPSAASI